MLNPDYEAGLLELMSDALRLDRRRHSHRAEQFLDAGEALLCALVDDSLRARTMGTRNPFLVVLTSPSHKRIVIEAVRRSAREPRDLGSDAPTDSMFRYRWRHQTSFHRDAVIWALRRRLPNVADFPFGPIHQARDDGRTLADALPEVAAQHVTRLVSEPAFRLQVLVEATGIARDEHVAQALHLIDAANIAAWGEFWQAATAWFGQQTDTDGDSLAVVWNTGVESVARAALATAGSEPDQALGESVASLLRVIVRGILAPAE